MAYALAASLVIALAAVSAAGLERPVLSALKGQFEYIRAWGEFGIFVEGIANSTPSAYIAALVQSSDGGSAVQAVWDGSPVQYDEKGASWSIPLAFKNGAGTGKAYLGSTWSQGSTFPWGVARLTITGSLSDPKAVLHASVGIIGSESVSFQDGSYVVMKSSSRDSDGLHTYLLVRAESPMTALTLSALKKEGMSASKASFRAEIGSPSNLAGAQAMELTMVRAAADEDAASLAKAWVAFSSKPELKRPDVRLTGMVDKPKVVPGDVVRYTYHLFNAGMDSASGLSVSIPVPSGGKLVAGSLFGDSGRVTLKPSAVVVDLEKAAVTAYSAFEGATELVWNPADSLRPGSVLKFSFDFLIR